MSLLIGNGYPEEMWDWPLSMVADEAMLVVDRENQRIASEAIVLRSAAAAVVCQGGNKQFDELINDLIGD